jgi:hypothetical protein
LNNTNIKYNESDGSFAYYNSSWRYPELSNSSESNSTTNSSENEIVVVHDVSQVNYNLAKDDLYMVLVIKSKDYANQLKMQNTEGRLKEEKIREQ